VAQGGWLPSLSWELRRCLQGECQARAGLVWLIGKRPLKTGSGLSSGTAGFLSLESGQERPKVTGIRPPTLDTRSI
jgi:hypothetical protein